VIGCGPVGLAVIASLKISGAHPIIAADFSPKRRALAVEMGADIVVDPGEMSPYMSWHQAATPPDYDSSRYAQLFGFSPKPPPAVIFECVGLPGVIQQVIDGAPAGARVVIVGVCMQTDQFEPFFGIVKQLKFTIRARLYRGGVRRQPRPHRRGPDRRDAPDHGTCRAWGRERRLRRVGQS